MASMQLLRLADLNLNYKIKEIMENNGFQSGKYIVSDGYPNEQDLGTNKIWPTVSIEIDSLFGRDIELGSNQWPSFDVIIDIFAQTDSQRDDIAYLLWDSLNETYNNLYEFRSGTFPSAVGNYSGLTILGQYYLDNLTCNFVPPDLYNKSIGEQHHSILVGTMHLPNL